jgi:hypothetical protein
MKNQQRHKTQRSNGGMSSARAIRELIIKEGMRHLAHALQFHLKNGKLVAGDRRFAVTDPDAEFALLVGVL